MNDETSAHNVGKVTRSPTQERYELEITNLALDHIEFNFPLPIH